MSLLEVNEDVLDIEVDVRMSLRTLTMLMNITSMYSEITGDPELIDVYEVMYQSIEPFGSLSEGEDGEDEG